MSHGCLTKDDLCWVLVKLCGAVLVYKGISGVYAMAVTWWQIPEVGGGVPELVKHQLLSPVKILFFSALLPLIVGFFLLASGATLHRLLMQIPIGFSREQGDSLAEKKLSNEELKEFRAWPKDNPDIERRNQIDKLVLFRDAQKAGEM